jgi:hypothetical protein
MSVFPGAIDSDATLYVARDNIQTRLSSPMGVSDAAAVVVSAAGWAANMIATVDSEQMLVTGNPTGYSIPVQRAFGGTAAATHAAQSPFSNFVDAAYQSAAKSAIVAIETSLGVNLGNIGAGPTALSNAYNFAPIQPGGTLASGGSNQVVTLNPLPPGINPNERSISSIATSGAGAITGATNASPIVITQAAHGKATNDYVMVSGVGGNLAANGYWQITVVDGNNYQLNGSLGSAAYTSGGTAYVPPVVTVSSALPITANAFVTISYTNNSALNGVWPVRYINPTSFAVIGVGTGAFSAGGYASFDNYHYLYISGGTGTPEAVRIQGGSGNTIRVDTVYAHSGAWTVSSASSGITEAIKATGSKNGCTIVMPAGEIPLYARLVIGDGDAYSSVNIARSVSPALDQISLTGQGKGFGSGVNDYGTVLNYYGATYSGGAIEMKGVTNCTLARFKVNASRFSTGYCSTAMQLMGVNNCRFENLNIGNSSVASVRALDLNINDGQNTFINVDAIAQADNGIAFGLATDGFWVQGGGGVSQNTFIRCGAYGGINGGIGIYISAADNNTFIEVVTQAAATGVFFQQPVASQSTTPTAGTFPTENSFFNCPLMGGVGGAGGHAGTFGLNIFLPYPISDGEPPPPILGVIGMTTEGLWFGQPPGTYTGADVASAASITPTGSQFRITGTATVNTINLPFTGGGAYASWEGVITMVPMAAVPFSTAGNIANAFTATTGVPIIAVFIASSGKWYLK